MKDLMKGLYWVWRHRIWHLSAGDRLLLLRAVLRLGWVRLGLWLLPFSVWRNWWLRSPAPSTDLRPVVTVAQIAWAVAAASRLQPGTAKCLARALTMQALLKQYSYAADLHVGVAKGDQGQLEAHAWVEAEGRVVIGQLNDLTRFVPLPSLVGGRS